MNNLYFNINETKEIKKEIPFSIIPEAQHYTYLNYYVLKPLDIKNHFELIIVFQSTFEDNEHPPFLVYDTESRFRIENLKNADAIDELQSILDVAFINHLRMLQANTKDTEFAKRINRNVDTLGFRISIEKELAKVL